MYDRQAGIDSVWSSAFQLGRYRSTPSNHSVIPEKHLLGYVSRDTTVSHVSDMIATAKGGGYDDEQH